MPDRLYSQQKVELIGRALELVPPRILDRIAGVRFHEGVYGRAWGGVLPDDYVEKYRADDNSFYSCPRVHQGGMLRSHREPTIALSEWAGLDTTLHELGHALWFAIIEPHRRWRCFWMPGDRAVKAAWTCGLTPGMLPFTGYRGHDRPEDAFLEQFAEAFALWLLPRETPHKRGGVERFYLRSRLWLVNDWGERMDNRRLLAFLNELAGWPGDLAPVALR